MSQREDYDSNWFQPPGNLLGYPASLNNILDVDGFVSIRNLSYRAPPAYIPKNIEKVFIEGSESVSSDCPNAAAAMFRLCLDMATKSLLPENNKDNLDKKVINKLYYRLEWLFNNSLLPESLRPLSECIRMDGNDGAHDGTITKIDAENLLDFAYLLLERIYTEPAKLENARLRREERAQSVA